MRKLVLLGLLMGWSLFGAAQTPVINSVVPLNTFPGDRVLISGSGFNSTPANLQVWFDQIAGVINASTDLTIDVTIPAQAHVSTVLVTNLVSGLSARSDLKFFPSFSGNSFDPTKVTTPLSMGAVAEIFDVCACDLDGDGRPDLAGSKTGTATDIMIQRNTSTIGNLSFVSSTLATAAPTMNLACADLNGDGKPELLASRGGSTSNEVFIYKNTGAPGTISFAAVAKVFLDPGESAFRISVRDLNLDGKPDIIVTDSHTSTAGNIYVFANQSSGGVLSINPTPIKLTVSGANTTYGLETQDLDGDKKPEIIVNQFNNSDLFIAKNTSSGPTISFSTIQQVTVSSSTLNHMATADFNEDGKMDIAVTSAFDRKAFLLLNTSSGSTISFAAPASLGTGDGPFGIDVSDIDGDGDVDLVVGNIDLDPSVPETQLTVLTSNGVNSGLVFTTNNMNVGKKTRNLRVADFDGDGKPDIAYTTVTGNSLDVIRNTNCFVPVIRNIPPITICGGQTVRLTTIPGFGVTNYDWKESGSTVSSGTNPFYDVTTPGTYTVTATSESGNCVMASASFVIATGSGSVPTGNPATTITTNSPVCTGNPIQLNTPTVAGVSYVWTGPAGFTSSVQNPVIASATPANAGVYTLVLTNGTCRSNPVTTTVEVSDLAQFSITSSNPTNTICQGSNLTLSVNALAGYTFQWIKDGVDIGGQTGASTAVTAAGSYSVRVTNTALSCSTTTSAVDIKLFTAPVSSFTVKATACTGEVLTFTNNSTFDPQGTAVYAWNFGDTGTSTVQSPTHTYTTASNFNPSLTVSYTGMPTCSNNSTKAVNVTLAVVPVVNANPPSSCPGDPVTLTVAGTFNSITWNTGASGTPLTVTQPGTYSVNTFDNNNCASTGQVIVTASAVPTIVVTADKTTVAPGQPVQLAARGADTWLWTPPETLSDPAISNPIATPAVSTTYTVKGTLTGGCSAQGTIDITVSADAGGIKPPNVFSPNGDGINDLWVITGIELFPDCTLTLFDKNGSKVFERKGYTNDWDGNYQGKAAPEGTYYYVFGCPDKNPTTGTLLLAR